VPNSIAAIKQQSADWNVFLDDDFTGRLLANDPDILAPNAGVATASAAAAASPPPPAGSAAPGGAAPAAAAPGGAAPGGAAPGGGAPAAAAPGAAAAGGAAPAGRAPSGAAPGGGAAPAGAAPASTASSTAAAPAGPPPAAAAPSGAVAAPAGAAAAGAAPGGAAPSSGTAAPGPAAPASGAAPPAAAASAATPPPVPKSLSLPAPANVSRVTAELEREMLALRGPREIDNGGAPPLVTQQLLSQHPEARLDETSGQLTLPPITSSSLASARSLQELGAILTQQLGVSKVKFELTGKDLKVTVGINPQTYAADLSAPEAIGKEKLQQMASEARATCARNDQALKQAILAKNPASIGRIIVGAGFAAVATYVTLPEAERANTIGVGFGDPWAARGENLMGQTSDYLRIPGLPDPELFNIANAGGYIPSQAFADSTAMARAMAGMAVFPGWAGPLEKKEDYDVETAPVTPINAAPTGAVQPGSPEASPDAAAAEDKRIKPIANADEQMAQKGKATGPVLVVGGGASAAWNVEKAKNDGASKVDWLARPAPLIPGSETDPKGNLLTDASFNSASGGGQRNKLPRNSMFVGNLANSTVNAPPAGAPPPAAAPVGAPGANPQPPERDPDRTRRERWAAPDFKLRVPIQTENGPILIYANAIDVTNGPGPARNLSSQSAPDATRAGQRTGLVASPGVGPDGRPLPGTIPAQINPASVADAAKLVEPKDAKVSVGVVAPPSNRVDSTGPNLLAGGEYNQVVVSIGQDAKAYGSYEQLIADFQLKMNIIWDHDLPDPANWRAVQAVPLGVESEDKSLRILGAAATEGPGLPPPLKAIYLEARNAQLGRIGDPGARAEAGISRVSQTFGAANAQLGGGAAVPLPNAGSIAAPRPDPAAPEGDRGQQKTSPLPNDPTFTPPRR
ncbi:MAG: hypothetical protein JWN40_2333, partial [Phycisphaerales bacterium]|nr:hypothetical protein [Phycisphaerales bacterium]